MRALVDEMNQMTMNQAREEIDDIKYSFHFIIDKENEFNKMWSNEKRMTRKHR